LRALIFPNAQREIFRYIVLNLRTFDLKNHSISKKNYEKRKVKLRIFNTV